MEPIAGLSLSKHSWITALPAVSSYNCASFNFGMDLPIYHYYRTHFSRPQRVLSGMRWHEITETGRRRHINSDATGGLLSHSVKRALLREPEEEGSFLNMVKSICETLRE